MPLRRGQVLESMRAQVAEPEPPPEELARRLREEHLAAVAGLHDSRGPVDVESDVLRRREQGLPGVDADPHPYARRRPATARGQRALRLARCRHGRDGGRKGDEERVALAVDLEPALRRERSSQQLAVTLSSEPKRPAPSDSRSAVEPSISVKSRLTLPECCCTSLPIARHYLARAGKGKCRGARDRAQALCAHAVNRSENVIVSSRSRYRASVQRDPCASSNRSAAEQLGGAFEARLPLSTHLGAHGAREPPRAARSPARPPHSPACLSRPHNLRPTYGSSPVGASRATASREVALQTRVGRIVVDELPVEVLQEHRSAGPAHARELEHGAALFGNAPEQEPRVDEIEAVVVERQRPDVGGDHGRVRVDAQTPARAARGELRLRRVPRSRSRGSAAPPRRRSSRPRSRHRERACRRRGGREMPANPPGRVQPGAPALDLAIFDQAPSDICVLRRVEGHAGLRS